MEYSNQQVYRRKRYKLFKFKNLLSQHQRKILLEPSELELFRLPRIPTICLSILTIDDIKLYNFIFILMEFKRVNQFSDELLKQKKSKFKDESSVRITAFNFNENDQQITVGLSDGGLMQFKKKGKDNKNILETKEYDVYKFQETKSSHKGEIKCLCVEQINQSKYIFTGSADRTIKLWENDNKSKNCIQTLNGHNGTIFALVYGQDTLFSGSNDKTFKIWRQENGREYLYHPWFVVVQIIQEFSIKKSLTQASYITCFLLKLPHFTLYAGDTEGSLHTVKQEESFSPTNRQRKYKIEKSYFNFHRLHIIQVLEIEKDTSVFTIGYDQKIIGFSENNGKFFSYKNPHKCLFTSLQWSQKSSELVASDEQGRIYFLNVSSDKQVLEFKLYETKICSLRLEDKYDKLFVITEQFIDLLKINRGVKTGNLLDQHKGPIVQLSSIEYPSLKSQYMEPNKLVSASLDNTIRIWDPKDMTCLQVIENSERQEISSMHYMEQSNLIATGHQNGDIKLWNIEIGSHIVLDQSKTKGRHVSMVCAITSSMIKKNKNKNKQIEDEEQEYLFTSGYDGRINVWEMFERKQKQSATQVMPQLKHSIMAHKKAQTDVIGHEILCILFDKATNCIVSAGNKAQIYFIDFDGFEHRIIFTGHKDSINCLAIDGRILFSGSDDKTIKLWDTFGCQLLKSFEAHDEGVLSLKVLPDTGHLVSVGQGCLLIWDYPNTKIIDKLVKPERIKCVVYMESEKALFVGTEENNIYSYQLRDNKNFQFTEIEKIQPDDDIEQYKIVQEAKKTFIISEDGMMEEKQEITNELSPNRASQKRKTFAMHDMTIEKFNNNDYVKQAEQYTSQLLQEHMNQK